MALGTYYFEEYRAVGRYGKRNGKRGSMRYGKKASTRIQRRQARQEIEEHQE